MTFAIVNIWIKINFHHIVLLEIRIKINRFDAIIKSYKNKLCCNKYLTIKTQPLKCIKLLVIFWKIFQSKIVTWRETQVSSGKNYLIIDFTVKDWQLVIQLYTVSSVPSICISIKHYITNANTKIKLLKKKS